MKYNGKCFLLSTFLVGSMTTEALTLPEPTTHTYSYTTATNIASGEVIEDNAAEITITINGYYGAVQL